MEKNGVPVTRLMTADVLTVTPNATITDAAATLLAEEVSSLVVVDESNRPVGMFTTTDLAEAVSADESSADATVERYMTDHVVTVGAEQSVRDAAAKMITNDVHHLPVTGDDDGVVGMLSTMDVTAYLSYKRTSSTE